MIFKLFFIKLRRNRSDIFLKLIVTFIGAYTPFFLFSLAGGHGIIKALYAGFALVKVTFIPYWGLSLIFHCKYGLLPNNEAVDSTLFWLIFLGSSSFMIIRGLKYDFLGIIGILIQIACILFGMALLSTLIYRVIRGKKF
jgi:hypothetical protein